MPIGQFPSAFNGYKTVITDSTNNLFESPRVYSIAGTNQYLLIVEAIGAGGRYFRSWTATSLDGPWQTLAATERSPFAGKANVTFDGSAWTNDISHGDIVRYDPAETMPVDPCNVQFVYQGFDKTVQSSNYNLIPYRMALLTLK
jgi:endo-1,4-beta-xylanase